MASQHLTPKQETFYRQYVANGMNVPGGRKQTGSQAVRDSFQAQTCPPATIKRPTAREMTRLGLLTRPLSTAGCQGTQSR
jgi:hypothetical protein